ncbi:MAG: sulfite exporter TauE/SafE family protein [Acidimicrobiia bacterium]
MTTASEKKPGFDPRLVLIGAAGGALSGFFGVGGGIILVPFMLWLIAPSRRVAHATSLGAIVALSSAGMVGFAISDQVDWIAGLTIGAGGVVGGVVGAHYMNRLSARTLKLIFATVLIVAGGRMVL